jgi:predicted MFS family arabinose efflux permease
MPSPFPWPLSERNRVLLVTLSVQSLNTWSMLAIAAIAPAVAGGVGVATVWVGYQIALLYSVAMVTAPFAGHFIHRWGALRVCQVSLLASALGVGLASLGTLYTIVLASIVMGFGYGLVNPASSHLLFQRTSAQDRSLVFSIKQTGVPLGGVIAGLVTPALTVAFGWQIALAAGLPIGLLLILLLQPLRATWDAERCSTTLGGDRAGIRAGVLLVWQHPRLRAPALAAFCFTMIQMSLIGFCVAFAVTELGFGMVQAGLLLAVIQGTGIVARLGMGWVADRRQDNAGVMLGAGLLSAAAALGFFLLEPGSPILLVHALAILFSIGAVGWNGVFLAEVARAAPPGQIGTLTGIASVMTFAGVVVGPSLFVWLQENLGSYGEAYLLLMLPALIGSGLLYTSRRARHRTGHTG